MASSHRRPAVTAWRVRGEEAAEGGSERPLRMTAGAGGEDEVTGESAEHGVGGGQDGGGGGEAGLHEGAVLSEPGGRARGRGGGRPRPRRGRRSERRRGAGWGAGGRRSRTGWRGGDRDGRSRRGRGGRGAAAV